MSPTGVGMKTAPSMRRLRPLRRRLARLRGRRRRFRLATAATALAIALLWALAGVFALDWWFQRNIDVWQRLLLVGLATGGVAWAFARFARPWLGKREDETDVAILVERQAGIDSDLLAALQFESADAAGWGSAQLQSAVIERVATGQKDFDVMAALPRQPLALRRKVLAATLAAWALFGFLAPGHVLVFFQRLAFGSQHYPTRTQLIAVTVNGKSVDFVSPSRAAVHVPFGAAVHFETIVAGRQPAAGRVEISTQSRGPAASVPLERPRDSDDLASESYFRGEYAALTQSARCQVYVGDAWTEPFTLSVTPLPAVEIEAEVVPPVYARQSASEVEKLPRGMRQFAVPAGSEVRLALDSDRPLSAAEVTIAGRQYPMQHADRTAGAPRDALPTNVPAGGQELWTLAAAGAPLALSHQGTPAPFDPDSRRWKARPWSGRWKGSILIEADLPPGITASTKTPIVLETGSP